MLVFIANLQADHYRQAGNLVAMRNILRPLINAADYPNDVGELAEKLVNSGLNDVLHY